MCARDVMESYLTCAPRCVHVMPWRATFVHLCPKSPTTVKGKKKPVSFHASLLLILGHRLIYIWGNTFIKSAKKLFVIIKPCRLPVHSVLQNQNRVPCHSPLSSAPFAFGQLLSYLHSSTSCKYHTDNHCVSEAQWGAYDTNGNNDQCLCQAPLVMPYS